MSDEKVRTRAYKKREIEKKVDSTHGSSDYNPVTYKGDVMVQVWLDSRLLATLSNWLEELDDYPRFMSEVVRRPLEILVEHLISEGKLSMIDNTATARRMLQGKYRINLNKDGRGKKNVMHNLILSDRLGSVEHSKHSAEPFKKEVSTGEKQEVPSNKEILEMVRKAREAKAENNKFKEEELNNARNSNMVVNETKEVTLKEGISNEELISYNKKRDEERINLERKPIRTEDFKIIEGV